MAFNQKESDNGVAEFQYYRPENRTKWQSFQKAIYDKSTNQIFGRTPKNWGKWKKRFWLYVNLEKGLIQYFYLFADISNPIYLYSIGI